MTNKEKYQQAFSVLQASGKITMEDLKMKRFRLSRAVAVAAAVAICFIGSNSICYAATGNTWVEKIVVYFDGKPVETEVEVTDMGEGNYSYTMEVPGDSSSSVVIVTEGDEENRSFGIERQEQGENPYIREENGIQWFCFKGERVNITEDFADGKAEGSISVDEDVYRYQLTGNVDEYSVTIALEE